MRILLVTSMVPDEGGVGAMPKLYAAELAGLRERHQVTLVASFGEDPGQADAAAHLMRSGLDCHIVDRRRSRSARRRWRVRAELAASWATSRRPWRVVSGAGGLQPLLDRLAETRTFDVVAVEDNPMAVLRYPQGVPTVLCEHEAVRAPAASLGDSAPLRERPLRALRALDWRRWDLFLPRVWNRFDLVQVFSRGDAEAVRETAPAIAERVRINPYGMILPEPLDPEDEEPGVLLFAGTFAHPPNRDAARWLATEIMPAVRQRVPDATLRLAGSSPPREVLDLAGPGIEVIADPVSMDPHLAAASVVLAPVRTGGGMRMKVLEAMALRRAVVTTSLGAEGFTEFGAPPLAIADSGPALAACAAGLLDESRTRRDLARRARDFAERHHSPKAWTERLEAVYEEAQRLAEHREPAANR